MIFENFEYTKEIFIKEQHVVKKLQTPKREIQNQILILRENIKDIAKGYGSFDVKTFKKPKYVIKYLKRKLKRHILNKNIGFSKMHSINHSFLNSNKSYIPKLEYVGNSNEVDIIEAATQGLVMLQQTYDQAISELF